MNLGSPWWPPYFAFKGSCLCESEKKYFANVIFKLIREDKNCTFFTKVRTKKNDIHNNRCRLFTTGRAQYVVVTRKIDENKKKSKQVSKL